jgi:hypothetical protein
MGNERDFARPQLSERTNRRLSVRQEIGLVKGDPFSIRVGGNGLLCWVCEDC